MANKRIRKSRRSSSVTDLLDQDAPQPQRRRQMKKRAKNVEDEIHRLECLIAAAPQMTHQRRLQQRDLLPPAEELRPTRKARKSRLPLHQQKQLQRRRTHQLFQLGVLLLLIAGVAGWLKQWLEL